MKIDERVSIPNFVLKCIENMLGEDYAEHATLKYNYNHLCLSFENGQKVKQIFHKDFIDLLHNIEAERKYLTKNVPIKFKNLDSMNKDFGLIDVAKMDKKLTWLIYIQKHNQQKDSFLEAERMKRE